MRSGCTGRVEVRFSTYDGWSICKPEGGGRHPMSLERAIKQVEFARTYTLSVLAEIDEADWFRMPPSCPTHVAWQVGHLAMAEYGLCLFRQRGRQPIDADLMSSSFRKLFSRGTVPDPEAAKYPSASE